MDSFLLAVNTRAADSRPKLKPNRPATWVPSAMALAMAAHERLGEYSPCSMKAVVTSPDLLLAILKNLSLVVPDDAPTLATALKRAAPWQRILLRSGEHLVDSRSAGDPGSSLLRIRSSVVLCGEPGAIIRGTIVIESNCAGGSISDLRLEDGGDCCLRVEGGTWQLARLRLKCAHGAALKASNSSRVTLHECVMGGEAESEMGRHVMLSAYGSVQLGAIQKRSSYAIVSRDSSLVVAKECALRECSEAAILVAHRARTLLHNCTISECTAAFIAGQGGGRALELSGCTIAKSACKLWFDNDRPMAFVWGDGNTSMLRVRRASGEGEEEEDDDDEERNIVPREEPRGYDDSDSDDSLEEQEFAGLERLMEALDEQALRGDV